MVSIFIIVAVDQQNGFSKNHQIPWKLRKDLRYFRDITCESKTGKKNAVIMGRVTYESIGKPLEKRLNIVITSQSLNGIQCCTSLKDAIDTCKMNDSINNIFIIGGERIYQEALDSYDIQGIYRTVVMDIYECDRFFPSINDRYYLESEVLDQEDDILFIRQYWKNNFLG